MSVQGEVRGEETPPRAVVDIGSNTVRLVIYGGPPRAPTTLHNEKVTARLGKGVVELAEKNGAGKHGSSKKPLRKKALGKKAQDVALAALARYRALLDLSGVTDIQVAATAATRDAANGPEFLDKVKALGFAPRQLSGEEEALTSANGVVWGFPHAKGIVADLGGGSLELTDIADGVCTHGVSLPLGSLHLPAMREGGEVAFRRRVAGMLRSENWSAQSGVTLYLVGGSLRAFARHVQARDKWPVDDAHGFSLPAEMALKLARSVARKPPVDPAVLPGISNSRVAALPHTASLLAVLIEELKPARLVFSAWGLREGLLFAHAGAEMAALNPLVAGVSGFVATRGIEPDAAAAVADWIGAIRSPAETRPELHLAATMLSLAASRIEPNLRASLAMEWALRKRWIGIEPQDRAMLAAAMLANANHRAPVLALTRLASPELLHEAQSWGLATRLCRRFTALAPSALAASKLEREGDALVLTLAPARAQLIGEGTRRDLKALADHLGLAPEVRIA